MNKSLSDKGGKAEDSQDLLSWITSHVYLSLSLTSSDPSTISTYCNQTIKICDAIILLSMMDDSSDAEDSQYNKRSRRSTSSSSAAIAPATEDQATMLADCIQNLEQNIHMLAVKDSYQCFECLKTMILSLTMHQLCSIARSHRHQPSSELDKLLHSIISLHYHRVALYHHMLRLAQFSTNSPSSSSASIQQQELFELPELYNLAQRIYLMDDQSTLLRQIDLIDQLVQQKIVSSGFLVLGRHPTLRPINNDAENQGQHDESSSMDRPDSRGSVVSLESVIDIYGSSHILADKPSKQSSYSLNDRHLTRGRLTPSVKPKLSSFLSTASSKPMISPATIVLSDSLKTNTPLPQGQGVAAEKDLYDYEPTLYSSRRLLKRKFAAQ
jgi:hypothetical protein